MLISAMVWMVVFVVSAGYGLMIENCLQLAAPEERNLRSPAYWLMVFYIGFISVNVLAATLSLLMPLSWLAFVLVALPGTALFVFTVRKKARTAAVFPLRGGYASLFFAGAAVLLVLCLWLTSAPINNADTYIYHAQSIRWIESYPAVRGLGNFFIRLAYNSNWFVQTALFSFVWLGGFSLHVLNGLLVFTVSLYFLFEFTLSAQDSAVKFREWLGLLLIPLGLVTIGTQSSAPSTDLPVVFLAWLAGFLALPRKSGEEISRLRSFCIAGLLAFALVVKLSIAPMLLLALLVLWGWLRRKQIRFALVLAVWMAAIALPWMARNIVVSGYAIYPVEQSGLPVDWRVPPSVVENDQRGIRAWGFHERMAPEEVLARPYIQRMRMWFAQLTFNQKGMVLAALFSPFIAAVLASLGRLTRQEPLSLQALLVLLSFYGGFLFWGLVSPNVRFGYAYMLFLLAACLSLGLEWLLKAVKMPPLSAGLAGLAGLLVVLSLLLARAVDTRGLPWRLVIPHDYERRAVVACTINEGKTDIFCARDYGECGYDAFPCHAWGSDYVRLRGEELTDGFLMVLP